MENNKLSLTEILKKHDLNLSSNPKGTDKGDYKTYVSGFYEKEFRKRRNKKNRLLEVGVRTGASMALWANYFSDAEIIGVDIEPAESAVGPLKKYLDYSSVNFLCMDAYDPSIAKTFEGVFSILIDDGPHSLSSQLQFIKLYLPKLAPDGVLIIEDIQGDYMHCYKLMRALPSSFSFEIHDFRKISGACDDMLFVVRHRNAFDFNGVNKFLLTARWFCVALWWRFRNAIGEFLQKNN
jgi:SAM-dependent methyltransferase